MIEKSFIIAFIVMFIWACFLPTMIFGFVRKYLETRIPEYLQKPIYDCPVCQVPYYGSLAYWAIVLSGKWKGDWIEWTIVIFVAGGINAVFVKLFPHDLQKMQLTQEQIIEEEQ